MTPEDATKLAQAMWEGLDVLGYDLDGDLTPAAALAGGVDGFIESFLGDMHQMRKDYDEALGGIPG